MSDSFVTPWPVACQAPLSMGFPRHEYWNGLQFLPPGDLPNQGTEPEYPALAGGFFTTEPPRKPNVTHSQPIKTDIYSIHDRDDSQEALLNSHS